jgi:hypothetical protein
MVHQTISIPARKCKLVQVPRANAIEFLEHNHTQGYCGAKYSFGLEYDNKLVAIMTFGRPRYNKAYEFELIRFCSAVDINVIGGASKLFKHFLQQVQPTSIISYNDYRWGEANWYMYIGFDKIGVTAPNYYYFKNSNPLVVFSRIQFQKHKLVTKLQTFDPTLTEWENMVNNNYNKFWDCGNVIWSWKR